MSKMPFPDRGLTESERAAVDGMRDGNLVPLAKLMAEENHEVHPLVQQRLLGLIAGSVSDSDHRIFVTVNPGLKDKRYGKQYRLDMQHRDLKVAMMIASEADFIDGKWDWHGQKESIVNRLENDPTVRLKRASIHRIWKEQEPFLRFSISIGTYLPRNMRPADGG